MKKGTGWCYWLTVNTREGMGVRSCGWIMERTEGRWPSLDPTKNSLWTQERAGHQLHPRAAQAGWQVERTYDEDTAPCLLVSLTDSAGKGENSGGLFPPPLARVHNDLLKESGRTQQLCCFWAGESSRLLYSCLLLQHADSYVVLSVTTELGKLTFKSGVWCCPHSSAPSSSCPSSCRARAREGGSGWAHLEDVKRDPLTEPKQDRPTKTGMIQDMTPRW